MALVQRQHNFMRGNRRSPVLRLKLALVLAVFAYITLPAQVYFSTRPDYLLQKNEGNNLLNVFRKNYPDTGITDLHNFLPANYLGNYGLPSPDLFFRHGTPDIGFRFFEPPYRASQIEVNDVRYYRSKGPYASLSGIAGSKELQIFDALFTHTYQNKLNFTLSFRRYTSKGFYQRQQTYTNNFYLSSNYVCPRRRFTYYFYVLNNSNKNNENGGIRDTLLNDSTMLVRKELMNVRIRSADRSNSETKVMFNPAFKLTSVADTALRFIPYLQLKSKFNTGVYSYENEGIRNDKFYRHVYLDTIGTFDSTHVRQLSNRLSLVLKEQRGETALDLGYRHELSVLWQYYDSTIANHLLEFNAAGALGSPDSAGLFFRWQGDAQYVVAGSNNGDYKAEGSLELSGLPAGTLFAGALVESRRPDHIYNLWLSNHFVWRNKNFGPRNLLALNAGWKPIKDLTASVLLQSVENHMYFGHDATPEQYTGRVSNLAMQFSYATVIFRHLGFSLKYTWQKTSQPDIVRVPTHAVRPKLFYRAFLFRKNLQIQLGGEATIFSAYSPYSYMPATQAFYLQETVSTVPYPYLDVFFSARIRPVSVFFKVENALHGFAGADYYFVPGYYQPDRAFRFGINWMFFD